MTTTERYGTVLRCYDNGGKTCDRYTIIPPRWARQYRERNVPRHFEAIGASAHPFHPQGFGQHVSAMPGPHLGRRIAWSDLPPDVQSFARQSFPEYAPVTARFDPFPVVSCRYGAPMGRRGDPADSWDGTGRLHACSAGGDGYYDRGGAYWGASPEGWVYAVWTRKGAWCTYIRARGRAHAIARVRAYATEEATP